MSSDRTDLTGQLLIAMPGMQDPRFAGAVVYLCAHSDEGAMGLIVNKPKLDVRFVDLLRQLDIEQGDGMGDIRVQYGGPVEIGRGFVLHSTDMMLDEASLRVDADMAMTASVDILREMARGAGPASSVMALGYAGWGPDQLEDEIAQNGWLIAPSKPDLVFGRAHEFKWGAALKSIGIDPSVLSADAGRA